MSSILRTVILLIMSAGACVANAQDQPAEKDAVAAVFERYVPYLNSANTDAISTEIYAVPVLMPLSGGRHITLNTAADFSKAWKSYLDAQARQGLRSIGLESVNVTLVGPEAATAMVTYSNQMSSSTAPVKSVWLYVLQKTVAGWRIVALFQQS